MSAVICTHCSIGLASPTVRERITQDFSCWNCLTAMPEHVGDDNVGEAILELLDRLEYIEQMLNIQI